MSVDINQRLRALDARRRGLDRASLVFDSAAEFSAQRSFKESYEKRSSGRYTRYALGAMQEVERSYTALSFQEAERVQSQISTRFAKDGLGCTFRMQGSVPGNIHIRGISDVDFLVMEQRFLHYDTAGVLAQAGFYNSPYRRSAADTLLDLRQRLEAALKDAYPAVDVDCSGAKAIQLSGGSLRRDVDVVPASWNDTCEYQRTQIEDYRGVNVLDKPAHELIHNLPFLYLRRLKERDEETWGGLKKAIRLCKTLKADAISDGKAVDISSYDIASALWNAPANTLRVGIVHELSILASATDFFVYLTANPNYAKSLQTPDGSRKVFDSEVKLRAVAVLAQELLNLSRDVSAEHASDTASVQLRDDWLNTLKRTSVPVID